MARVNLGMTPRQRELEADLKEWAGEARYLSAKQVGAYLGLKDNEAVADRLRGLPYQPEGKRRRYHVRDLAKRFSELETA